MAAEAVAVPDRGASGQGTGLFHAKDRPAEGYGPPPAVSLTPIKSPRSRLGGVDGGTRGPTLRRSVRGHPGRREARRSERTGAGRAQAREPRGQWLVPRERVILL